MGNIEDQVEEINGFKVLATQVDIANPKAIRETMDNFKSKLQDTIIILISEVEGKVSLIATVPKADTSKIKASDIIKNMAPIVGGKGGGRPIWHKVAVHNLKISQNLYALLKITLKTITIYLSSVI